MRSYPSLLRRFILTSVDLVVVVSMIMVSATSSAAQEPEGNPESTVAEEGSDGTLPEEGPEAIAENALLIDTLPSTPGVTVSIEGQTAATGPDGKAMLLELEDMTKLSDRIQVDGDTVIGPGGEWRAEYSRLYRRGRNHYTVAMNHHYPLRFSFVGTNGESIEIDRIEELNLKSSIGDELQDVDLTVDTWVHAQRVVSTQRGPEARDIEWSIESAFVRSSNIVNRAQVRFFPAQTQNIEVPVLFFSAKFKVHDMFFLSPAGDAIDLTYPDGEVITHTLENGELSLDSLPRGEYKVLVLGSGPKIARPVVLSRNQEMDLEFLSWLDMSVVGVVLMVFVSMPLIIGIRSRLRRKRKAVEADKSQEVIDVVGHLPCDDSTHEELVVATREASSRDDTDRTQADQVSFPSGSFRLSGVRSSFSSHDPGPLVSRHLRNGTGEDHTPDGTDEHHTPNATDEHHTQNGTSEDTEAVTDPGFKILLQPETLATTTVVIDRSQIGIPYADTDEADEHAKESCFVPARADEPTSIEADEGKSIDAEADEGKSINDDDNFDAKNDARVTQEVKLR